MTSSSGDRPAVLPALRLAVAQLGDPRLRRVAWRAAAAAAVLFAALVAAADQALAALVSGLGLDGIGWAVRSAGAAGAVVLGLVLFPGFAGFAVLFMLGDVARAVEARHYPELPPAREEPLAETLAVAVRFCAASVGLNLLVLVLVVPALLATVALAPLVPLVVLGLNGHLLGREFFEFAAARRMAPAAARRLRRRHRGRIFLRGVAVAALAAVPVANWLMPVVAAAFMIHVLEDLRARDDQT